MLRVRARVGPSTIHGLGLIAAEFIPAGAVVWEMRAGFDLELTGGDLDRLAPAAREQVLHHCDGDFDPTRGVYTLSMDDARFTNHADDPNTATAEGGRVTVASRDIRPGDEITWDYRSWSRGPGGEIPAHWNTREEP